MSGRAEYIGRLKELIQQHAVSVGPIGPNPGFIEDEMVTRESYHLVRREAIRSGELSEMDLAAAGLPEMLDQP